jgi:hypothetical protein
MKYVLKFISCLHSHAVKLSGFKRSPSGQMQATRLLYSSSATQR